MRFHWVDRDDGGSSYETKDTKDVLATVERADNGYRAVAGMAVDVRNIEGNRYETLDEAKQAVDQAVNYRYYQRTRPGDKAGVA